MIGRQIADPHRIESGGETVEALGILNLTTVMAPEKTLSRVHAVHLESGHKVSGYEIHHGETLSQEVDPVLRRDNGEISGAKSAGHGLCWGTYLHGIFDADAFRRWFIDRLRVRRGLPAIGRVVGTYDLEPAFDRLADTVRRNLRMDSIYKLLGL
jgi:cobyric acid synthase